jgi:hypothetical protein
VKEIQAEAESRYKRSTTAGKERKNRLVKKIFYESDKTVLHIDLYKDILPMFKSFLLMFEQASPMIHRLHDEQTKLVRSFLCCFIKHEEVKDITARRLKKLDVKDERIHMPLNVMYTGSGASKLFSKLDQQHAKISRRVSIGTAFLPVSTDIVQASLADTTRMKLHKAYVEVGAYILAKMPLDNVLLKRLSAIDPKALGHSATYAILKKLREQHFPTVLTDEEMTPYEQEVSKIQLDNALPCIENSEGKTKDLDVW